MQFHFLLEHYFRLHANLNLEKFDRDETKKNYLTPNARILQGKRQAASCDALASSGASMQFDYEDLYA